MDHFQSAWQRIQDQLVPFFIYGLLGFFLSACAFYIPMLSVLRELKDALAQDRVPDLKNAFDMDRIKNDLPMWGALMGSMFAVTVIFLMLTLPVIGISVVFGGEFEWLVILLMFAIFGLQFLVSFSTAILLFWSPWIYLSEGLSPIDTIKASFFYGKSTFVQVIVHMLIVYFSMMVGMIFCYVPAFLALTVGAIASFNLYEAHRSGIQKIIAEHGLLRIK